MREKIRRRALMELGEAARATEVALQATGEGDLRYAEGVLTHSAIALRTLAAITCGLLGAADAVAACKQLLRKFPEQILQKQGAYWELRRQHEQLLVQIRLLGGESND